MANKTFLRSSSVYEAPNKRLQNDIELIGATVTRANGRATGITFGGGGAIDFSALPTFASNAEAVAAIGVGKLYQSTALINGSPIILITV